MFNSEAFLAETNWSIQKFNNHHKYIPSSVFGTEFFSKLFCTVFSVCFCFSFSFNSEWICSGQISALSGALRFLCMDGALQQMYKHSCGNHSAHSFLLAIPLKHRSNLTARYVGFSGFLLWCCLAIMMASAVLSALRKTSTQLSLLSVFVFLTQKVFVLLDDVQFWYVSRRDLGGYALACALMGQAATWICCLLQDNLLLSALHVRKKHALMHVPLSRFNSELPSKDFPLKICLKCFEESLNPGEIPVCINQQKALWKPLACVDV